MLIQKQIVFIAVLLTLMVPGCNTDYSSKSFADDKGFARKLYDSYAVTAGYFGSAKAGDLISDSPGVPTSRDADDNYNQAITMDRVNVMTGDFSVKIDLSQSTSHSSIGFFPGVLTPSWSLDPDWQLEFYIKTTDSSGKEFNLITIDTSGKKTGIQLGTISNGQWKKFSISLSDISGVNLKSIKCFQIDGFDKSAAVWLDGVVFTDKSGKVAYGVSEKTIRQMKSEAAASIAQRTQEGLRFVTEVSRKKAAPYDLNWISAKLTLGEDLEKANDALYQMLTTKDKGMLFEYHLHNYWYQSGMWQLCIMYKLFSDKSDYLPGRMSKANQKALLELLWESNLEANSIYLTKKSTWWIIGSENHDLQNMKVPCMLASQIFMNEPEYASRIYPDYEFIDVLNWFNRKTGPDHPAKEESASMKKYTARDHYKAWVKFFREYIEERGKKGFFQEVGSPGYGRSTVTMFWSIYEYCDDKVLKADARKFLDLIFASWAQDQLGGVQGGAMTRCYDSYILNPHRDFYFGMTSFLLGGSAKLESSSQAGFVLPYSDYQLPDYVWDMTLDRRGLGKFEYISRKPGEAENIWPRPLGTENTILCNSESSRFVRYSWVTPSYILGTQMDHPGAFHTHTSVHGRYQGVQFNDGRISRIATACIETADDAKWKISKLAEPLFRSVQYKTVLISQSIPTVPQGHPHWFPGGYGDRLKQEQLFGYGLSFSGDFDTIDEADSWIFIQEGNGYAAIRVVDDLPPNMSAYNTKLTLKERFYDPLLEPHMKLGYDTYQWNKDKTILKFNYRWSSVIIETSDTDEYKTLADFKKDILDNELTLHKGHVSVDGFYNLTYTSCKGDEYYFNASCNEIPMVNGEYINYSYPKTFYSPYIESDYGKGVIKIKTSNGTKILKF